MVMAIWIYLLVEESPENIRTSPESFILQNDKGIFTDVTAKVCPALQYPGMVTSAVWTDYDNDKQTDLIIAGEWMPVRFFKNNHGRLTEATASTGSIAYEWHVAKPDRYRYGQ